MKTFVVAAIAGLALTLIGEAYSQSYPSRPVRIIVPFSAGSQTDMLARLIGVKLAENSGQQAIVDNRPSAGGIVAGSIIASATPDGHTFILHSNSRSAPPASVAARTWLVNCSSLRPALT